MASIQEQLKHIRTSQDDWYSEHRRIIGDLARIERQPTPPPPTLNPETKAFIPEADSRGQLRDIAAAW
ncbi:hypothetical protein N7495_003980 [Penicillium taxi]|uniref:uncharacterized protein n=1 Tax=Penicillium taxi TaxID=168475 RepID=UPI002544E96F|nr:uncharacterized protein N7495_003980 [Penicillium taxi]KAJ5899236.1 hypothetical protein N7495_003980 [Penicillium taxi]